jgi:hypothetical protein
MRQQSDNVGAENGIKKIMIISPGHYHNFSVIPSSVGHFRCEHCLRTNLHLYAGENKYFGIRGLFSNSHLMGPSTFIEIIYLEMELSVQFL